MIGLENLELLEELIPFNKENAVTKSELADMFSVSERAIRHSVELLREQTHDYVIISSSQFKGYYKTKDPAEIQNFIEEQTRRAKKILWNLKKAKQFLGEKDQLQNNMGVKNE